MSVTDEELRTECDLFQQQNSRNLEPVTNLDDDDLYAAFVATRDFLTAQKSDFNQALPNPARTELSASHKEDIHSRVSRLLVT